MNDHHASSAAGSDFLAAEMNHRIANSLSLIASLVRMQANSLRDQPRTMTSDEALLLLTEVATRIETVGLLHRRLSVEPRLQAVNVGDYLREICNDLVRSLTACGRVNLSYSCASHCLVPASQIVPLALITSEAVTNAIEHAHPTGVAGSIDIGCRRQRDRAIIVEIADDGVGLPEHFDPQTDGGLGLQVMRLLGQQVGASLKFRSNGLGLHVQIALPKAAPAATGGPPSPR